MKLPDAILAKTLARFDSLISEGCNMLANAADVPPTTGFHPVSGVNCVFSKGYKQPNPDKFVEWRTKATTLLALVIPRNHIHWKTVEETADLKCSQELLQSAVSVMRGCKDDLEKGFLDGLAGAIEAEIACDYMGQAEQLLAEGHGGKLAHVPAAVLAGAVLEKGLRTLCAQQQPPIAVKDSKGNPKTMCPLIDDLKKAGAFNEAKAKQLRAWADIRNLAAHGEFAQFKRSDVEGMVAGISNFLADYLN
ncbi:MAG TPA: DUF4145 domain-containing protein [Clostridia bacterium]|nr:DUF4145 domain-containing protein [Clostridia bacterium]